MEDAVEERFVNSKSGNGLFAKRNFQAGEVIFEEAPLVVTQFVWNEDCNYRSCEKCLRPLETAQENARRLTGNRALNLPLPELDDIKPAEHRNCGNCGASYCSAACLDSAYRSYHKRLCHVNQSAHPLDVIRETWKQSHHPPESFNVMAIAKLAAMFLSAESLEDKKCITGALARFQCETANANEGIVHRMLGPNFEVRLEVLRPLFAAAFPEESVTGWWTKDGFLALFAVFARNAQGVGVSSYGTWAYNVRNSPNCTQQTLDWLDGIDKAIEEKTGLDFMDNEGSGLFVRQRASNHSCDPNTEVKFRLNNATLSLIARRPIHAGEEVFITYLDNCALERSRHSRQKELRSYYLFNCSCQKCQQQADQADETSEDEDDWESDDPMEEE
ncbi:SET and MYND domain-containing protein 5 [Hypsibius exemplaris]|uniref:SET and MYND domain-containing protein 5 n=1 Tax=Hypsibius exemplaris TaxID=2072580 RepID=A0A1W0WGF8_HYPEX|nr:SET and MYND domain-containing protein 5 [Hypsibius exemplaris]